MNENENELTPAPNPMSQEIQDAIAAHEAALAEAKARLEEALGGVKAAALAMREKAKHEAYEAFDEHVATLRMGLVEIEREARVKLDAACAVAEATYQEALRGMAR